jgi:hypothetical protein
MHIRHHDDGTRKHLWNVSKLQPDYTHNLSDDSHLTHGYENMKPYQQWFILMSRLLNTELLACWTVIIQSRDSLSEEFVYFAYCSTYKYSFRQHYFLLKMVPERRGAQNVEVIPMAGKKGSGTPFRLASWKIPSGTAHKNTPGFVWLGELNMVRFLLYRLSDRNPALQVTYRWQKLPIWIIPSGNVCEPTSRLAFAFERENNCEVYWGPGDIYPRISTATVLLPYTSPLGIRECICLAPVCKNVNVGKMVSNRNWT